MVFWIKFTHFSPFYFTDSLNVDVHSTHLLFDHFQFALIHGPNIPGSYAILLFIASDFTSITSHIHNWVLFLLWLRLFILHCCSLGWLNEVRIKADSSIIEANAFFLWFKGSLLSSCITLSPLLHCLPSDSTSGEELHWILKLFQSSRVPQENKNMLQRSNWFMPHLREWFLALLYIVSPRELKSNRFVVDFQSVSRVRLFATPWTVAHQALLSMGFPRQDYWSG